MPGSRRYLIVVFCGLLLLGGLAPGLPAERLPPEVEAIRAEREAQRVALDRIREKTEALRRAENQRMLAEREQAQRVQAAERERQHRELVKEVDAIVFWFQVRIRAKAALPWLAALYGAFVLLPLFSLYRMYIESLFLRPIARTHPVLIGSSALCFSGALWILSRGGIESDPETLLNSGFVRSLLLVPYPRPARAGSQLSPFPGRPAPPGSDLSADVARGENFAGRSGKRSGSPV